MRQTHEIDGDVCEQDVLDRDVVIAKLATGLRDIVGHCAERGTVTDDHLFQCIETDAVSAIAQAGKPTP